VRSKADFLCLDALMSVTCIIFYFLYSSSNARHLNPFASWIADIKNSPTTPKPTEVLQTSTKISKQDLKYLRETHEPKKLTSKSVALASTYDFEKFRTDKLRPLLIERVAGTAGLDKAAAHIESTMPNFYHKEVISHTETTPFGKVNFKNLVFTSQPDNPRQIIISCHYDSKYWPNKNEVFIGATDSSFPCALILQMAEMLDRTVLDSEVSLKLVFFDGEEAFVRWTMADSTYGSKFIARKWKDEGFFENIEVFMLLDLLGEKMPKIYHDSQFRSVNRWFERLIEIENDSRVKRLFKDPVKQYPDWFDTRVGHRHLGMDDDHKPFHRLGLDRIIHIIPAPFPTSWHTARDNEDILDDATMYKWQVMINLWTMEYLGL